MPALQLPNQRQPLPDELEIPYITALFWLAFGVPDAGMPEHANVPAGSVGFTESGTFLETLDIRADYEAEVRSATYWHWRTEEGDLPGVCERGMRVDPEAEIRALFPERRELSALGLKYLRHTIRLAKLYRMKDAPLLWAEKELRRHARAGRIRVRAKKGRDDAIPEALDHAYFRNDIRFCWQTYGLGLASDALDIFDHGFEARESEHHRFDPLVSASDLRRTFVSNPEVRGDGPALMAARRYMNSKMGERVTKPELKAHLEREGFEVGSRPWKRISKAVTDEFPTAFKAGRPRKKPNTPRE